MPGALQPDGGETGGPQTESGRDREEGVRRQGPSLPTEAGTAITGQTSVPPESLSSANYNPEPPGLATQSPHTQGATGMSDAQNKKAQENTQVYENHKQRYKNQKIKMSNATTTTTEAPTTTTTRTPSRLREMDGSLSSSAWVCAPLLLAASALAYTAVG
ncbi:mucin TcMUCII [Trypanosoma cruzi]|nr:mucin TcMUCII [Trypanosoma cruzi]